MLHGALLMDDRFNTIAGWTLFGGIVALGLSSLSAHYFQADKRHELEKPGYAIEGVEEEGGAGEAAVPLPVLLAAADPAKGQALFAKCKACHTDAQGGANGIGPNLWATMGEGIAQGKGGFAFSDSLKGKGGTWTFEAMDAWLANPKKFAEGTKMSFAGLPKGEDRANMLVYLNSLGSNLPLPKAEAVAAPAADASAPAGAEGAVGEGAGPAAAGPTDPKAAGATSAPVPAEGAKSTVPLAKQ